MAETEEDRTWWRQDAQEPREVWPTFEWHQDSKAQDAGIADVPAAPPPSSSELADRLGRALVGPRRLPEQAPENIAPEIERSAGGEPFFARILTEIFKQQGAEDQLKELVDRRCEEASDDNFDLHGIDLQLDDRFSRYYSWEDADYGHRGGYPYYKPKGWMRMGVAAAGFQECKDWCVAYHGTKVKSVVGILMQGLQRPGEGGVKVRHGQAGSETKRTVYLSPSIEYAAHPVYSQFFSISRGLWAQVVLQCRVKPGSFRVQGNTLLEEHWPSNVKFDENFPHNEALEWLVEDPQNIHVTGLMVREFGCKANKKLYGKLNRGVTEGTDPDGGPEFEWTKIRVEDLRKRGQFVRPTLNSILQGAAMGALGLFEGLAKEKQGADEGLNQVAA